MTDNSHNAEAQALREGVQELAAVLQSPRASTPLNADSSDDALVRAMQLVAHAQGISIQPLGDTALTQNDDRVREIARHARFRVRGVTLTSEWWKRDGGPILAFAKGNAQPLALLPSAPTRYEWLDPTTNTRTRVDEKNAATLDANAFVFYRPFPARSLDARDLIAMGLQGEVRDLLMVALMGVGVGILGALIPIATSIVFSYIIPGAELTQLAQLTLVLLVAVIAAALFGITQSLAILRIEGRMGAFIQSAVWDRLLALPVPFFRNFVVGDLADRALGINQIRAVLTTATISALLGVIVSLFSFVLLFYYDASLALLGTALYLVYFGISGALTLYTLRFQRALANWQGKISGLVLQVLTAISKIRVAGAEERAYQVWAREFAAQKTFAYRAGRINNALAVLNALFPILWTVAIFAGVAVLNGGNISTGTFLGFSAAFAQFGAALLALNAAFVSVVNIVPTYERVKPILSALPEVDATKANPGALQGALEASHVSFRYDADAPYALQDVSLRAAPGEFIALAGPSGAGKSTLLRLLLGFEKPEAGSIYYDGQDLAGLDAQAVRHQIGVVLQDGKLVPGDLFHNIVGASRLTVDDAWAAAKIAGLDEDIRRMPMGMFTVVNEGAASFSGGQKQRLMIARAVVGKPRLLFFDEATSALDNATQAAVSDALKNLNATRVVIAHRLSTIQNADRIYVIVGGRVAQVGSYAELIAQPGPFRELVQRQLA